MTMTIVIMWIIPSNEVATSFLYIYCMRPFALHDAIAKWIYEEAFGNGGKAH